MTLFQLDMAAGGRKNMTHEDVIANVIKFLCQMTWKLNVI